VSQLEAKRIVQRTTPSSLPANPVIIIGGADVIEEYNKGLDKAIKLYNDRLEKLSSPYFIRTRHTSNGYQYPGRYFYKWVWSDEKQRMKRQYVGVAIPEDDAPDGGFPKAPINILEGFEHRIFHHDVICSQTMYDKFFRFFEPHRLMVLRLKV
jgi:hypothetical protein